MYQVRIHADATTFANPPYLLVLFAQEPIQNSPMNQKGKKKKPKTKLFCAKK
jgi:hypothetical protein